MNTKPTVEILSEKAQRVAPNFNPDDDSIKECTQRIQDNFLQVKRHARYMMVWIKRTGDELRNCKFQVKRAGMNWSDWFEDNRGKFDFSRRTAQLYMRVSRKWKSISMSFADPERISLGEVIRYMKEYEDPKPIRLESIDDVENCRRNMALLLKSFLREEGLDDVVRYLGGRSVESSLFAKTLSRLFRQLRCIAEIVVPAEMDYFRAERKLGFGLKPEEWVQESEKAHLKCAKQIYDGFLTAKGLVLDQVQIEAVYQDMLRHDGSKKGAQKLRTILAKRSQIELPLLPEQKGDIATNEREFSQTLLREQNERRRQRNESS